MAIHIRATKVLSSPLRPLPPAILLMLLCLTFMQPSRIRLFGQEKLPTPDVGCSVGLLKYSSATFYLSWPQPFLLRGWAKKWSPGCENFYGQAEAGVVSNSRNKIHQTWAPFFSPPPPCSCACSSSSLFPERVSPTRYCYCRNME